MKSLTETESQARRTKNVQAANLLLFFLSIDYDVNTKVAFAFYLPQQIHWKVSFFFHSQSWATCFFF